AHIAVYELYDDGYKPHGSEWQALVRQAGFEPMVRMTVDALRPKPSRPGVTVLYDHRCAVCGYSRSAKRPVTRWRCPECRAAGLEGELEITSRPPTYRKGRTP
ncbi:MAG: hypothetical protein KAI47_25785, partial [Deltaproteobacteria bacterium]|nr:hypothetical protein [Deltaproteobacteria bacterium]